MSRAPYSSDLTDAQWQRIAPLIPPAKPGGRHRSVDIRAVLNAIFYRTKTGCQWRNLPHDLPAVADGGWLLPHLATQRRVGNDPRCLA